jgi:hypothetical protein
MDSIFKQLGNRHSGATRSDEPGISRFQVWSFGPSRNDGEIQLRDLAACFSREFYQKRRALLKEGAGNAGRSMRPQPGGQKKQPRQQ